jgi:hypothetical protein
MLRVVATLRGSTFVGLVILGGRRFVTLRRWIGIRGRTRIVTIRRRVVGITGWGRIAVCGRIIDIGHTIAVAVEAAPITDFLDRRDIDVWLVSHR